MLRAPSPCQCSTEQHQSQDGSCTQPLPMQHRATPEPRWLLHPAPDNAAQRNTSEMSAASCCVSKTHTHRQTETHTHTHTHRQTHTHTHRHKQTSEVDP